LIGRIETFMKWAIYAAAAALVLLVQGSILQYISIFGAMPFLYPLIVVMVGIFEGAVPGAAFSLVFGVLCDLTMTPPIPCFYTLVFPLAAYLAALISTYWLPTGFLCSLLVSVMAFLLGDAFHCLLLAMTGKADWAAGALMALRETGATIFFVPLVYLLFRAVHRHVHKND
jgi:rod shape-determining protein MreD